VSDVTLRLRCMTVSPPPMLLRRPTAPSPTPAPAPGASRGLPPSRPKWNAWPAAPDGERPGGNEEAVAEDDGEGSEGSAPIAKWHQIPNVRPCVSGSMCTRFILFACSTMVKKVGPVFVMTL